MSSATRQSVVALTVAVLVCGASERAVGQGTGAGTPQTAAAPRTTAASVQLPPEYVIGADDVLGINFWRDADMTGDVTVRPDGRITLPLLGDLTAAGLTPEALRENILEAASKLIEGPAVTVIVRQINSRKVFITGQVTNPNAYPLTRDLTVLQLVTLAGGLTEYADKKNIRILRVENGQQRSYKFNYHDVAKGKNLAQNIVLKPGDTVVVP